MHSFNWESFNRRLVETNIASSNSIRGCAEDRIDALELRWNVSLPGIYREYLHHMGEAQGHLTGGDYCLFEDLDVIQEFAKQITERHVSLPVKFFAFGMDGSNTQILFFDCEEDTYDPPIYHYMETEDLYTKVCPSFSAWLLNAADEVAEYIKNIAIDDVGDGLCWPKTMLA